jgi:hypothetical protein
MLAYVFWHRPRAGVEASEYERRVRAFHARLEGPSASFRINPLPFADGEGYEDWYLVDGWSELGALNAEAVSGQRRRPHDSAAELASEGWGGVYALLRGAPQPPAAARWFGKPVGESYESFLDRLPSETLWQRQMVLGPAAEFCAGDTAEAASQPGSALRSVVHFAGRPSARRALPPTPRLGNSQGKCA